MALAPGTRLGPYEVVAQIGVGGMGEVYKATDTNLKRGVAIKVLPASVAGDTERLARFQREAEVLAALNHPNIAQIYGLEKSDGITALAMELVEGPTLADRIAQGAVPIDEALSIAKQIAEALEAAHEQGIIHRDLKPANIKVRADGTVKVLDFGLAKAMEPSAGSSRSLSMSPTITTPAMTQAGMILGTAAYMSPEQARGKTVDKRADIWAFGAVLFETLTGTRAFPGEDLTDTLAAVVKLDPKWDTVGGDVPPRVRQVLRLCLQKDPRQRAQAIGDVRLALDGAFESADVRTDDSAGSVWTRHRGIALAATTALLVLVVAAVVTTTLIRPAPVVSRQTRFEIILPSTLRLLAESRARTIAISPDGARIAYVAQTGSLGDTQIVVRALDSLEASVLPGTANGRSPFFSQDGRWVAFFSGGELRKVSIAGGPPITISDLSSGAGLAGGARNLASGMWDAHDTIFFSQGGNSSPIQSVPAAGGQPKVVVTPNVERGEIGFTSPISLPSQHALIVGVTSLEGRSSDHIDIIDLSTGQRSTLISAGSLPEYVASGHLLYLGGGTLNAVALDLDRLVVRDAPAAVVRDPAVGFVVANDGTLAYVRGTGSVLPASERAPRSLVWVDRNGSEFETGAPPRAYQVVSLSADGARAVVDIRERSNGIWVWDFARRTLSPVVVDATGGTNPVWLPNSPNVAFFSRRDGKSGVFLESVDGTGSIRRLSTSAYTQFPKGATPDGKYVLTIDSEPQKTVMSVVAAGGAASRRLLDGTMGLNDPAVSPDGRWIAYQSTETGRSEVYVRPFPEVDTGRWQASVAGGWQPVWAHNSRELFFFSGEGLTAVSVQTTPTFSIGPQTRLFATKYINNEGARSYDVSPDGQRFLMMKDAAVNAPDAPGSIVVVQHFDEEVKRLVPTK